MMRMIIFGIAATSLWALIHLYLGLKLIRDTKLKAPYSKAAWGAIAAHGILAPIVFFSRRFAPTNGLFEFLTYVAYLGMGFIVTLFLFLVFKDLIVRLFGLAVRFRLAKPPVDEERRQLLTAGFNLAAFAVTGVGTAIGNYEARKLPAVEEVEVPVEGLPKALDGFTIVQLSDIHIGPTLKKDFMESLVEHAMGLKGDLIAVTGDLVDGYVSQMSDDVAPIKGLSAPHGVFFVTGNHEYYWDAHAWVDYLRSLGITVLMNEHQLLPVGAAKLLVGGVTDYRAARHIPEDATDPHKAKHGAPEHDFSMLLAHQPTSVYEAQKAGWDLQLSGHTHGGQFFPWNLAVGLYHEFVAGLGKLEETFIYVSRGAGYWGPPNRLGAPSEITRITLKRV